MHVIISEDTGKYTVMVIFVFSRCRYGSFRQYVYDIVRKINEQRTLTIKIFSSTPMFLFPVPCSPAPHASCRMHGIRLPKRALFSAVTTEGGEGSRRGSTLFALGFDGT